ncbi:hypothetical protein ACOMHN_025442 [Nucella lapillus]
MPAAVTEHTGPLPGMPGKQQQAGLAGSASADGFGADGGGLLFKQVTPRRRHDQFGRDNTRHADYLLSMAVFPTGVRAPLLSDLQRRTEHQCGFEVIDKATERTGSRHVHIIDSKEVSRHGSATDSAKKPPPKTPLTASFKLSDRRLSQSFSVPDPSSDHPALPREKRRWAHATVEATRVSNMGVEEKKKMKDIRDPLYLNTYCPEERRLRYKKTSLPRVSNRTRPWSVSEPNPAYRFVSQSQEAVPSSQMAKGRKGKPAWFSAGQNFRIDARDVMARNKGRQSVHVQDDEDGEAPEETESVSGSQALLEVKSYFPVSGVTVLGDQRDTLRGKQGCLHAKVKQCIKFVKYREKLARSLSVERPLKAENGRYRPFSTTTIRTPRDAPPSSSYSTGPRHPDPTSVEIYKEFIDTIALQTRLVSAADRRRKPRPAVSGVPRNNTAASSYRQDSAIQSVSDSNRPPTSHTNVSRPSEAGSGSQPAGNPSGDRDQDRDLAERGRDQDRGAADPRGVYHALDIIRLSPKAQPPRSSRSLTRGGGRSTYREEVVGEGEEEEEEGGEGKMGVGEGKGKTHAIILPNVSKSATTSVCSFVEESVNAADT